MPANIQARLSAPAINVAGWETRKEARNELLTPSCYRRWARTELRSLGTISPLMIWATCSSRLRRKELENRDIAITSVRGRRFSPKRNTDFGLWANNIVQRAFRYFIRCRAPSTSNRKPAWRRMSVDRPQERDTAPRRPRRPGVRSS